MISEHQRFDRVSAALACRTATAGTLLAPGGPAGPAPERLARARQNLVACLLNKIN